jgi:UDP-N-acetylmuramoyl-L-alanyl-D-glutamate--2,6-diaminopimelate ligase
VQLIELLRSAGLDASDVLVDSWHKKSLDDVVVFGITANSKKVNPGCVFAALPGHLSHGARYASAAVEAGAAAIITDKEGARSVSGLNVPIVVIDHPRARLGMLSAASYGWPARSLTMMGVTGTNGKTTVTHLIQGALLESGISCGLIGTLGTSWANVKTIPHERTTPESPDLHESLAAMIADGVRAVAMEVSSIALREHRIDGIDFDVAVFTGLTQDHLDYHGSMKSYFEAKADLFSSEHARHGVVAIDDDWGRQLVGHATIPTVTLSARGHEADWNISYKDGHIRIDGIDHASVRHSITTDFTLLNMGLAVAVAHRYGISAQAAAESTMKTRVPGRLELVASREGIDFIVDYAHTPDAIREVVSAAARGRHEAGHRVIVVLGAGGDRDPSKRSAMGEAAAAADLVVVTDDNPRSEDPALIRSEVRSGVRQTGSAVQEIPGRREAIEEAVRSALPGDVVLVLGKGHETTQEFADHVLTFDDREVLAFFVEDRFGPDRKGNSQ